MSKFEKRVNELRRKKANLDIEVRRVYGTASEPDKILIREIVPEKTIDIDCEIIEDDEELNSVWPALGQGGDTGPDGSGG